MKKILILLVVFGGAAAWAAQPENTGTVNITVLDESGALVLDAPVYIYGEHKTHFVGGKEVPGTTTVSMPAGDYRISSALLKKSGDYYDRFASHEAHVQVVAGDNTVLVLTLKPINTNAPSLGYPELSRIGAPSDVAHSLN
jgi:hypothetical protein